MRSAWRWTAGGAGAALGLITILVSLDKLRSGEQAAVTSSSARGTQSAAQAAPAANASLGALIVHEWGTFTNFSGADGVQLEFRPHVANELPEFVYDRYRQAQSPFTNKGSRRARLRMETPVTYFYTDLPREVSVNVRFPQGLLTEFYPPVRGFGPGYLSGQPVELRDSFLDWGKLKLIPQSEFSHLRLPIYQATRAASLPEVSGDDHYGYARETDSAVIETSDQFGVRHFEKFLFYRGLGKLKLPVTLSAHGDDRFTVSNSAADAMGVLLLIQINDGLIRFAQVDTLAGHARVDMKLPTDDITIETLSEAMRRALVATGLYDREALAMVKTWRSSWFGEDGTRLLYLVPRRLTDEVLPLTVSPAPDETVRVLVGRIEMMTPQREQHLRSTITALGTCVSSSAEPLCDELRQLGRFAEPALERTLLNTDDPSVRSAVAQILDELREQHPSFKPN